MAEIGKDIQLAADLLKSGQLIGMPTETVYGLAGNATNEQAILEIFKVKNRPKFDPLIAHTNSLEKIEQFVQSIPPKALQLANTFWPGPLTLLLDKQPHVPDLLTSGLNRVAVRIPSHPLTLQLLEQLDFPLAAPSANPFGYVSPTKASHVNDQLGHSIPYILDGGECKIGLESTIVGFEDDQPVVYRLGGLSIEAVENVIGPVTVQLNQSSNPAAPGMLKSHYAPKKRVLIGDLKSLLIDNKDHHIGVIAFREKLDNFASDNQIVLSPKGDLDEAASGLFAALRQLDQANVEIIITEKFPDKGLGKAINDRLKRAAAR